MVKDYVIGIDIGTSSSRVGIWQKNHVEIIPNDLGKRKSSSYVSFTNTERLVGDRAFYQVGRNYKNTTFDFKRLIGLNSNDININSDKKYWPFKVIEKDEKVYISIEFKSKTKNITPIELYSMMLVNMKETAENYLGQEISDAVITVPANFNNTQRIATMKAAAIAGLNVLQIINEPTAAALAYGFNKEINKEENVLIVDLGGGTFDVTLFTINNHTYKVKATGGDTHLGGEDFTNRLIDYFVKEFKEKYKIDPSTNPKSLRRLRTECEKIKISLTSFAKAQIDIDYFYDDIDFSSSITRSCFEEISSDLFEKIDKIIKMVIGDSGLDKSEINEIVLVGGSTRIPKFRNIITTYFDNKDINKTIDVDEAVTCGAAIQAFILSGEKEISEQIKDITISDVVSHSISIHCKNYKKNIIKRNSSIPKEKSIEWTIPNNQDSISFKIYEEKNQLLQNNYLLDEFIINNVSPLSSTIKINITFNIDINGILKFSVDDYYKQIKIISTNNKNILLNRNEIDHIKENAKEYIEDEKKEKERIGYMNNLEIFAYDLKTRIEYDKIIYRIPSFVIKYVNYCIINTIEWIKNNQNASKEEYEKKKYKLIECRNDEIEWINVNNNVNVNEDNKKLVKIFKNKCIISNEKPIINERKEKKRILYINFLIKCVYIFKIFIEDERNVYVIPLNYKKSINNSITNMIKWIKYNQNASIEDFEEKVIELREIHKHLKYFYNQYKKEENENERIESMNNLVKYANDFKEYISNERNIYGISPDIIKYANDSISITIEWINNNQNASKEDYETKKNELREIHNHLKYLYNQYEKKENERIENERIESMNNLVKYANDFKEYISNERNIYGISPDIIKYANDSISITIEWINNNQNASKEDYETKKNELREIHNHLKYLYNQYEKKENERIENERIESMNNRVKYANDFKEYISNKKYNYGISPDDIKNANDSISITIEWINNNQNASKEDYETKKKELREIHNHLKYLYNQYEKKENERIESMNNLVKYANDIKEYISNEKNIYGISPDIIKYANDSISITIEWINNNQNASKENYETKKKELREIHNHLKYLYNQYEKKENERIENERIESMNNLVKYANYIKEYISNEKNIYGIPPDDIKNTNDSISITIEWINNNQNASKEDYERKENELKEIHNHLKYLYNQYEKKENERIESMNNLVKYANDIKEYISNERNIYGIPPDDIKNANDSISITIEWINNNQNASKEDYETKKNELREIHNHLKYLYNQYEKKENERIENERIESMNNLVKYANDIKEHISNERNIYGIPPDDIKNANDSISITIEWINNNQNASKEDYETKKSELREIHNHLNYFYNQYEKERIEYMNFLIEHVNSLKTYIDDERNISEIPPYNVQYLKNSITNFYIWIQDNKNTSKENYINYFNMFINIENSIFYNNMKN